MDNQDANLEQGTASENNQVDNNNEMASLLAAEGIQLDGIYVCPHRPSDGCTCRKPQPELLEKATREHQFKPSEAFVIGDQVIDIASFNFS